MGLISVLCADGRVPAVKLVVASWVTWLVHFSVSHKTAQKSVNFCGGQHGKVHCCAPSSASALSSLRSDNLLALLPLLDLRRSSYVGESREGIPGGEDISFRKIHPVAIPSDA